MADDKVSREAKLAAAKDIVTSYIASAVVKNGDNQTQPLSIDDVCKLFAKVYDTVDSTLPNAERKVGLGV